MAAVNREQLAGVPSSGRVALYFCVRYVTPLMVLLALAAGDTRPNLQRVAGILTAQVAIAVAVHAVSTRSRRALGLAVSIGMAVDVIAITTLVSMTGGASGPLVFLYTVHALAAGILLSSRAGLRMLLLETIGLIAMDIASRRGVITGATVFPRGLEAVAALWILGGAGTLFSIYNERELRRRNAELDTIRRVTLDMTDSLTLEEIFADLTRGVAHGFGFEGAAILLRDGAEVRCVAAQGITGVVGTTVELRGRLASAMALSGPLVTSREQARRDGVLIPLIGPRGYIAVPLQEDGVLIATRAGRRGRPGLVRSHEIEALARLAHHARLAITNGRLHAKVAEMAVTDALTGLINHGEMQRRLAFEAGRVMRYATLRTPGHALSVMMIDIDHFKRFNDRFGHQAGDAVLKGVAGAVRNSVRSFDIVARYGGEELAVILPETGQDAACDVAERVRRAVEAFPYAPQDGGKPVRVTVSIGVATMPENGTTPAMMLKQADAALYRSKEAGRNRVSRATQADEPVASVVAMDPTRRRRVVSASRARGAARRARVRSSLPKPRTPRA